MQGPHLTPGSESPEEQIEKIIHHPRFFTWWGASGVGLVGWLDFMAY